MVVYTFFLKIIQSSINTVLISTLHKLMERIRNSQVVLFRNGVAALDEVGLLLKTNIEEITDYSDKQARNIVFP